jgi:hypothetical protein
MDDRTKRPYRRLPELLTPEQERIVREALVGGATRHEAAALIGITRQRLDTRLRDQLKDLRVGQGRRERNRQPQADPEPWEIALRAAAIRRTWPPERWLNAKPIDPE